MMAKNMKAGRMKVVYTYLLLFGPALFLIFIATRGCQHKFKQLDDYGAAKNYSFIDVFGKEHRAVDYKGNIVVLTTLQEKCPDSCAVSFWHLDQILYQQIRKNNRKKMKQVRLISFATDGKGNPIEDLSTLHKQMQDRVEGYDPKIWILAKGTSKEIFDFKRNGQSLLQKGDKYFGGHAYQELMLLLDKQNHLRMVLSGKTEGMIRRMREHVALLQKQYDKENKK